MKVELLPKSRRLKQLIKEYGAVWELIEVREVQCFNDIGYHVQAGTHKRWCRREEVKDE